MKVSLVRVRDERKLNYSEFKWQCTRSDRGIGLHQTYFHILTARSNSTGSNIAYAKLQKLYCNLISATCIVKYKSSCNVRLLLSLLHNVTG